MVFKKDSSRSKAKRKPLRIGSDSSSDRSHHRKIEMPDIPMRFKLKILTELEIVCIAGAKEDLVEVGKISKDLCTPRGAASVSTTLIPTTTLDGPSSLPASQ